MPMFLYENDVIHWLESFVDTSCHQSTKTRCIRDKTRYQGAGWGSAMEIKALIFCCILHDTGDWTETLNSSWHSSRTCQYEYFPSYVLLTKWWISLWDLSDCALCGALCLPSITIVLLHYRLMGESLKTTNRNYMRGLGGREGGW